MLHTCLIAKVKQPPRDLFLYSRFLGNIGLAAGILNKLFWLRLLFFPSYRKILHEIVEKGIEEEKKNNEKNQTRHDKSYEEFGDRWACLYEARPEDRDLKNVIRDLNFFHSLIFSQIF
jgi:hypothetical protein